MRALYHVTPKKNRMSIYTLGINPSFSRGSAKRSWWCSYGRLQWAIAHVAAQHGVREDQIIVFVHPFHHKQIKKFSVTGVYYTKNVVRPFAEAEKFT
jgi:hypothetical protein